MHLRFKMDWIWIGAHDLINCTQIVNIRDERMGVSFHFPSGDVPFVPSAQRPLPPSM